MNDNLLYKMAKDYGTPLYVYDGEKITEQFESLKSILPDKFEVFYSMKCNPLIGICQLFKSLGSCIEVASDGELYTALSAGYRPENIIYSGPGKTAEELEYAINEKIYCINIESVEEAALIEKTAQKLRKKVDIAIRINPDFDVLGSGIRMSGASTQFGIDQSLLAEGIPQILSFKNINLIGVHVYCGTQMLNAQSIITTAERVIELALSISRQYGFSLKFLDVGGGFGIPYFRGESYLDINVLKDGIKLIWNNYCEKLSDTRIAVESGRFLMAESGAYLIKALYKKKCKGSQFVVCDGGSSQHASSAFLGRHIRNNFPMHVLGKYDPEEEINIVGPLCTPTDIIGQKVNMPCIEEGDIIAIEKSGAYGLTQSPWAFLSHSPPAEVLSYNNQIYVLRERGHRGDFTRGQNEIHI